jgi:hypothetical protein
MKSKHISCLKRTNLIFSSQRSDERRDPGDDVEVVHEVAHVLSEILGLAVILTAGSAAGGTGNAVVADTDAAQC